MENDRRLVPWLELATELEVSERVMGKHDLAPTRTISAGLPEVLDTGADVGRSIRDCHELMGSVWLGA